MPGLENLQGQRQAAPGTIRNPQSAIRISVIIPSHNGAHLLPECLKALWVQTFRDFEIVVVDDASTDRSFRSVIVGSGNGDPYGEHGEAIRALAHHFGLDLDRAHCYPYRR